MIYNNSAWEIKDKNVINKRDYNFRPRKIK
jgi:hypothetical protein